MLIISHGALISWDIGDVVCHPAVYWSVSGYALALFGYFWGILLIKVIIRAFTNIVTYTSGCFRNANNIHRTVANFRVQIYTVPVRPYNLTFSVISWIITSIACYIKNQENNDQVIWGMRLPGSQANKCEKQQNSQAITICPGLKRYPLCKPVCNNDEFCWIYNMHANIFLRM